MSKLVKMAATIMNQWREVEGEEEEGEEALYRVIFIVLRTNDENFITTSFTRSCRSD